MKRVTTMAWGAAAVLLVVMATGCGGDSPAPTPAAPPPQTEAQRAAKLAASADDARQARDVVNASWARPVNCAAAATRAFSPHTGESQVWVFRGAGGVLECFDTKGFHRTRRGPLQQVTTEDVEAIESRPDLYPPPPPLPPPRAVGPPPPRRPPVETAPDRELGVGPCCRR